MHTWVVIILLMMLSWSSSSQAQAYWLVGIDDGNHCHIDDHQPSHVDANNCACIAIDPLHTHWQVSSDLTHCIPKLTAAYTQSQCLHIIYMNAPYPALRQQQCMLNHLPVCDATGDLSSCTV